MTLAIVFFVSIGLAGKPGGRSYYKVVELARRLGMDTVVESDEAIVPAIGCDYGQGYYYSPPLPVADFTVNFMSSSSLPESGIGSGSNK